MDASPYAVSKRFSRITDLLLCCSLIAPSLCHAALIDRGGGLIYDTDLNITWLSNARYGVGSGYDDTGHYWNSGFGLMTWQNAMNWAANLSYYDSVRNVTYDDWRLPTTRQPDGSCISPYSGTSYGYNCIHSEMGHLFYNELGGVAGQSTTANSGLFTGVSGRYWSATASGFVSTHGTPVVWGFFFTANDGRGGLQDSKDTYGDSWSYAWAVRDGDVYATSAAPVPAAGWLFVSGLLPLLGYLRK